MNNFKAHINELYIEGSTSFRDIDGAYPDYVVKLDDMVEKWAVSGAALIRDLLIEGEFMPARISFDNYVESEIRQLCVDYYED